ncbi:MAG: Hpt domain-containing protein [Gammaproteobacteria bacterium]|jgi:HPt (histidine-containing phosphotransfer) domain-containing protein|nr:Hpt domain-containing protein [Xanthomonadales bacterium]
MDDAFLKLKTKYQSTFPAKATEIKTAWEEKDFSRLGAALHKLKGSSGSYGFNELSSLCEQAQSLIHNELPDNTENITVVLNKIFQILK